MPYIFCNCTHCKNENSYETAELKKAVEGQRAPLWPFGKKSAAPAQEDPILAIRVVCKHCFKPYKVKVPRSKLL